MENINAFGFNQSFYSDIGLSRFNLDYYEFSQNKSEENKNSDYYEFCQKKSEENKKEDSSDSEDFSDLLKNEKKKKKLQQTEEYRSKKSEKIKRKKQERERKKIEENFELYKNKTQNKLHLTNEELHPFIEKVFGLEMNSKCLKLLESNIFSTFEKYSEQEIDALLSNKDFILLGRSGTGKTMVALTKIFLIKMCANLKESKCLIPDLFPNFAIRVIFCATSPNLIEEAFNYYSNIEKKWMGVMKKDHNPISRFSLHTFDLIEDQNYPLFITTFHLILLIDSILNEPLFLRDTTGKIISESLNIDWYSQENIKYKVQQDFFVQLKKVNKNNIDNHNEQSSGIRNVKLIEFNDFNEKFWKSNKKELENLNLSPLLVWSEIISIIKGAPNSYLDKNFHLSLTDYLNYVGAHKTNLQNNDKKKIWEIAQNYEKWKIENSYFDLMDVVSYSIQEIINEKYFFPNKPHALFIDEVQDMQPSILYLFTLLTQRQIVFCGDTAQTIAKGIDFRFSDLKKLFFYGKKLKNKDEFPLLEKDLFFKVLNINFRSQSKIIELSNSIISLLETFFPTSIDKIRKEIPLHEGVKSILLSDEQLLKNIFYKLNNEILCQLKPTFGSSFTILVRNKQDKEVVSARYSEFQIPVFTIFEAKGLEFDNVVLYNFFTNSECSVKDWAILNEINIKEKIINSSNYYDVSPNVEDGDNEINEVFDHHYFNFHNDYYNKSKKIHLKVFEKSEKISNINFLQHQKLKTELKSLYTAVTRTRLRLLMYDENLTIRNIFEKLVYPLDLLEHLSIHNIDLLFEISNIQHLKLYKTLNDENSAENSDIKTAFKFFNFKFYWQAYVLFKKVKDEHNADISLAYHYVEKAKNEFESCSLKDIKENYCKAAKLFEKRNMIEQAAKSFYSADEFELAKQYFIQINYYSEAGETILQMANNGKKDLALYFEAVYYFEKANNFIRAIEVCSDMKNFDKALELIKKYKNKIFNYANVLECHFRSFMKYLDENILKETESSIEKLFRLVEDFSFDLVLHKIVPGESIIIADIEKLDFNIYNELNENFSNDNKFLIFFLMKKFNNFFLAEKITELFQINETYLFFLYTFIISDSDQTILDEISKNVIFNDDYQLQSSQSPFFRNLDKFFVQEYNYLFKLFLIVPQIIINKKESLQDNQEDILIDCIFSLKQKNNRTLFFSENLEKIKKITHIIVMSQENLAQTILDNSLNNREKKDKNSFLNRCEEFLFELIELTNKLCSLICSPANYADVKLYLEIIFNSFE